MEKKLKILIVGSGANNAHTAALEQTVAKLESRGIGKADIVCLDETDKLENDFWKGLKELHERFEIHKLTKSDIEKHFPGFTDLKCKSIRDYKKQISQQGWKNVTKHKR